MVDKGYEPRYEVALRSADSLLSRMARGKPEDTLRFYALRLHEVGMIKTNPQQAHRAGHRLAVSERAEERAEGVSGAQAAS